MTTPDPQTITAQLLAIEAEVHRAGWDRPPQLLLLYDAGNGPRSVSVLDPQSWRQGLRAAEVIGSLATSLAARQRQRGRPPGVLLALRRQAPGCYGAAVMAEAWGRFNMTTEQVRDYEENPRSPRLADRVGSVEVRHVNAYDRRGIMYGLTHVRGQEPSPVDIFTPELRKEGTVFGGAIPEALAALTAVVIGEDPAEHAARVTLPEHSR